MLRRVLALAGALAWGGAGASAHAAGEPQDGFPSWEERVVEVLVNRARADPQADLADCAVCAEKACYAPRPPMAHDHALARAARFHSANLARSGAGLRHDSPCTLVSDIGANYVPGPCDGSPTCACVGGTAMCNPTCTSWSARVSMFGAGASAENAAAGTSDPVQVFYLWLHEPDSSSACGWRPANGHRHNILGDATRIGVGHDGGFWTQDFSGGGGPATKIVVGAHHPRTGTVTFRAHWYDAADPQAALVNVEGACTPMTKERGAMPGNATYAAAGVGISGCRRYYFMFRDAAGAWHTYPEAGSFGAGDAGCADWDPARPPAGAGCEGAPSPPDAGPGGGDGDGGLGGGDGGGGGAADDVSGGCGCRAGESRVAGGWLALAAIAALGLRRGQAGQEGQRHRRDFGRAREVKKKRLGEPDRTLGSRR